MSDNEQARIKVKRGRTNEDGDVRVVFLGELGDRMTWSDWMYMPEAWAEVLEEQMSLRDTGPAHRQMANAASENIREKVLKALGASVKDTEMTPLHMLVDELIKQRDALVDSAKAANRQLRFPPSKVTLRVGRVDDDQNVYTRFFLDGDEAAMVWLPDDLVEVLKEQLGQAVPAALLGSARSQPNEDDYRAAAEAYARTRSIPMRPEKAEALVGRASLRAAVDRTWVRAQLAKPAGEHELETATEAEPVNTLTLSEWLGCAVTVKGWPGATFIVDDYNEGTGKCRVASNSIWGWVTPDLLEQVSEDANGN